MDSSNTIEKVEMLKHTMDRYDHYYDSINNKSNLFLALNTFLLGGIVTGYYSIKNEIACGFDILFFVWVGVDFLLAEYCLFIMGDHTVSK